MHTCKNCSNFSAEELYKTFGYCLLMGDSNDFEFYKDDAENKPSTDRCYGWDYEGYSAGTYVGKDFGCIHWEKLNGSNND